VKIDWSFSVADKEQAMQKLSEVAIKYDRTHPSAKDLKVGHGGTSRTV
jgi:hypothetical protein